MKCVYEVLPRGTNEWEEVVKRHELGGYKNNRSAKSIKDLYRSLKKSPKPTGDPTCPSPVRIAKQADKAIDEKADTVLVADGDSEFDSEPSDAPTHDSNSDGDEFSDADSAMATLESGVEVSSEDEVS
ncbi:hypothetical protein BCR33DRAFT_511628 [Rhizoclosmatium globosum]|uniref:DUF6818 domain-containing protein n=1 Tax=Rhizoclosmatium globosum TaxID=329046 RepID=A0A1Y2BHB7_9FUNG|nr:hypothetical protein BCR33DRAFT_511628 [Rhizoclosmatium globosum]|eukprot:ORY34189.1 hypothetical protein BCR33DRAFT_511628 [Rhizoclosmatium globosum]